MSDAGPLIAKIEDAEYWRRFSPELSVSDAAPTAKGNWQVSPSALQLERERLARKGYAHFERVIPENELVPLRRVVERLHRAGLPTPFTYVYDEFWSLFQAGASALSGLLGEDYRVLADVWTWRIESGQEGWPSHRDHAQTVAGSDGLPNRVTVWIPLVDVTEDLAPVELVPLDQDTNYPDAMRPEPEFPASLARPMVGGAGSIFIWSANALHRGGAHRGPADRPRLACSTTLLSAECKNVDDTAVNQLTSFGLRSRLDAIAQALVRYQRFVPLGADTATWAEGVSRLAELSRMIRTRSHGGVG